MKGSWMREMRGGGWKMREMRGGGWKMRDMRGGGWTMRDMRGERCLSNKDLTRYAGLTATDHPKRALRAVGKSFCFLLCSHCLLFRSVLYGADKKLRSFVFVLLCRALSQITMEQHGVLWTTVEAYVTQYP